MTRNQDTESKAIQVRCLDLDCDLRGRCPHSQLHLENAECKYICGAGDPLSRCYPEESNE